ncbi:MAG TPA: thermonuclease family protein [Xanthobacteraceae bacterium]|nr:thermonuclease family protein [Xanthobacteraceae bacterium]
MTLVRRAHPSRLPACLPGLALLASIALVLPCTAAAEPKTPAAPAACTREPVGSGTVDRVVDGRTFMLADGRQVRLAGIEIPPLPQPNRAGPDAPPATGRPSENTGAAAAEALRALVAGREVVLMAAKSEADRYGRLLADAALKDHTEAGSIAKMLVSQGLARVAGHPGTAACRTELQAAERAARAAKLGLWADPRYFPRAAEDVAGISAERGQFTLVEGKVVSVRESGGTIYVNFGRRWSEDFTVTIAKRKARQFSSAGLDPRTLTGRHVMVRGWIEQRGGPWIEASAPEQIEIVADK